MVITPDQKAAILAQIADLKAALTFAIGLTDDQRRKMLKMGDKTVGIRAEVRQLHGQPAGFDPRLPGVKYP